MLDADAALTYLLDRQRRDGLKAKDMAARLGMRKQEWSRITRGHRPLGPLHRERAMAAFPELREILFARVKTA